MGSHRLREFGTIGTFLVVLLWGAAGCRRASAPSKIPETQQPVPSPTPTDEERERLLGLTVPPGCRAKAWTAPILHEEKRWAKEVIQEKTGIEFVFVPKGSFWMGSLLTPAESFSRWGGEIRGYEAEHPRHEAAVGQPLYLGKYEITLGQFRRFADREGYITDAESAGKAVGTKNGEAGFHQGMCWRDPGFVQTERNPVTCVSWQDARAFCQWANLRLPSEEEWEYACRAGSDSSFSFGEENEKLDLHAWHRGNAEGASHPVGCKRPNGWGLFDMHGNILEWCEDVWRPRHDLPPEEDGSATSTKRVLRGGGWGSDPRICRSCYRLWGRPSMAVAGNGFRAALDLQ